MRDLSCDVASLSCAGLLFVGPVFAGDLMPPVGPVAETMKDLQAVEPRTPIGAVTTPGTPTVIYRVDAPGSYYLIENLTGEAAKVGIFIAASGVSIDLRGFVVKGAPGSLSGIQVAAGTRDIRIVNGAFESWGIDGIDAGSAGDAVIESITASGNGRYGINMNNGSLSNCAASLNADAGIRLARSVAIGCTSNSNTGDGFLMNLGAKLVDCLSLQNDGHGIAAQPATSSHSVSGCSAVNNNGDGIRIESNSLVSGNTCISNATGIHVIGSGNRIDANDLGNNAIGLDIDGDRNLIIRNTLSFNTTSDDIAAGNAFGPLLSVNGLGDLSGVVGADHPLANLIY